MVKTTVTKNKFSQLNDKRFSFPNGIVSLPFHKEKKRPKNRKIFLGGKIKFV